MVSGESGAGKTETTKLLIAQIMRLSSGSNLGLQVPIKKASLQLIVAPSSFTQVTAVVMFDIKLGRLL